MKPQIKTLIKMTLCLINALKQLGFVTVAPEWVLSTWKIHTDQKTYEL